MDRKKKPNKITNRPAAIARLKKSCWVRPTNFNRVVCQRVITRLARTGGIRRPVEECMYNPPTQKVLRNVRGSLYDGLCMGQLPDVVLGRRSPNATPGRGRKRGRVAQKAPRVPDEPPTKRRRSITTPSKRLVHPKPPRVPGSSPKPKAPGPGYCHNCKKARDSCIVCPNVRTHRFCTNCVSRHFSADYEIIFNQGIDCWEERDGCPVCFWQCPCAACKRRMNNRKLKAKGREKQIRRSEDPDEEVENEEAEKLDASDARQEEEEEEEELATAYPEQPNEKVEDTEILEIREGPSEAGDLSELHDHSELEEEDEHPINEDSSEANIEGHTHSEEDLQEIENQTAPRKRRGRKRRIPKEKEGGESLSVSSVMAQIEAGDDAEAEGEGTERKRKRRKSETTLLVLEDEEEDEGEESRQLCWSPLRIMARRTKHGPNGKEEYFVMWKDRWLNGDDTISLYRKGQLKEILKKRKRKRHPMEYLVRRAFSWESKDNVPQHLLDLWRTYYQRTIQLDERGKGKGKGEGWDSLWQKEMQQRRQSGSDGESAAEQQQPWDSE